MRKLSSILLALVVCLTASAQVTGLNVGYCDGQLQTQTDQAFGTKEKNTWVSGAIYLPAGDVNTYAGNRIDSIRVGLAQKLAISEMKVWVRETLDGENLAEGSLAKADIVKGWNNVELATPFEIPANNTTGLYIGYSTYQTGSNYGMSVLKTPQPNALWVQLGTNAEWVDRSSEGTLCLEAMIAGDQLPKLNLRLLSLSAPTDYVMVRGQMKVVGTVKNMALQTVTGFDVETRIDGVDAVYTSHVDLTLDYLEESTFSYTIEPAITEAGKGKVSVTITKLNEGDDENLDDNTAEREFDIVAEDFTRRVLLEEFTTEQCPNCPRVGTYLHNILEEEKYKDGVVAVCHHSAYYTDWLTIPSDNSFTWYFNDGGATYAPAIMLNRNTEEGNTTPIFNPSSENQLRAGIDYYLSQTAFVSVDVQAKLDTTTNVVNVVVKGSRSKEDITVNPARITVWLIEDNIAARSQAGATTWTHQHVNRAINSTWGDVIEWDGNNYTYECQFKMRSDYKQENMSVAAMIFDYDENATKNNVANANQAPVTIKEAEPAKGDLNGDGEVGIGDIIAVTNVMADSAGNASIAAKADVNGDGEVGIGDIIAITNIMAGEE